MLTAIILIQVERKKVNEVAEKLLEIKGLTEVYSVSGHWDLVAILRVSQNEQLGEVVTSHITQIEGIHKTETMVAFKAFSKHDLECMFDIGNA